MRHDFGLSLILLLAMLGTTVYAGTPVDSAKLAQWQRLQKESDMSQTNGFYSLFFAQADSARQIAEMYLASDDTLLGISWGTMGVAFRYRSQYDSAEYFFKKAIDVGERAPKSSRWLARTNRLSLANLYLTKTEFEKAEATYLQCCAEIEKEYGSVNPLLGTMKSRLAGAQILADKLGEAEANLFAAKSLLEQTVGPGHRSLIDVYNNLGILAGYTKDSLAAREHFERSIALTEKHWGSFSPRLVAVLQNASECEIRLGNPDRARRHLARAIELQSGIDPNSPMNGSLWLTIASILRKEKKYAQADTAFANGYTLLKRITGTKDQRLLNAIQEQGEALIAQSRHVEAALLLLEAQRYTEEKYGIESWEAAGTSLSLVRSLIGMGQFDEAERILISSLPIIESHFGHESLKYGRAISIRGNLFAAKKRDDLAELDYLAATEIYRSSTESNPGQLISCYTLLRDLYQRIGRTQAFENYSRAVDSLTKLH